MTAKRLLTAFLVVVFVACAVGAIGTLVFIVRFGLFASRPPLSPAATAMRLIAVLVAGALLFFRRPLIEQLTFLCVIAGAGASFLFGLGVRSDALAAVRLIFHLLAYSVGGVAIARLLLRSRAAGRSESSSVPN